MPIKYWKILNEMHYLIDASGEILAVIYTNHQRGLYTLCCQLDEEVKKDYPDRYFISLAAAKIKAEQLV